MRSKGKGGVERHLLKVLCTLCLVFRDQSLKCAGG